MKTTKLSELVARPDRGRVFTEPARPGLAVNDARYDGPDCLQPPGLTPQVALF